MYAVTQCTLEPLDVKYFVTRRWLLLHIFQVDVNTFYQPDKKQSKISEAEQKHNSLNHTEKKAEEGGLSATTAVPVIVSGV